MQECLRILFCENSRYILLHQRILVVSKVSTMTITTTPDLCFMLWEGYGSITTLHHLVVVVLIQKKKKKKVFDLCVEIKKSSQSLKLLLCSVPPSFGLIVWTPLVVVVVVHRHQVSQ